MELRRYSKRLFIVGLILAAAFIMCVIMPQKAQASDTDDYVILDVTAYYDLAEEELELVNEERAEQGLSALVMDETLQEAAMQRAAEISVYFSHTRPDGTSCFTITSLAYGENIAAGYSSASSVTTSWMNSSGHRANILGSSYTTIGIGCVKVGSIKYWVQLFGTGTATESTQTDAAETSYTVNINYDTVTYDGSGFNLNMLQDDPEEISLGDTYELVVGILNPGWSGTYAHTSGTTYTWVSSNTSVVTVSSTGLVTAVGLGTATVSATSPGGYTWTKNFSVSGASITAATVTLSYTSCTYSGSARKPSVTVTLDGETLKKDTDYTLTYENNINAGTASVTVTGKGNYKGTAIVEYTIKAKSISSADVTLSNSSYTYSGSAKKPSVKSVVLNGTTLSSSDYSISYSSGRKNIGSYTVTVTGKGNYKGTATATFKIKPGKVTVSSVKSSAAKKLTVKWGKVSGSVTGYQVRYKKSTSDSWTTVTVKSASTLSKTISSLTAGKKYNIQVRAYKTVSGTKYYGSWSSTKSVTVKKAQTLTVKSSSVKTVKYSKVRNSKQTVKVITKVSGAQGTVTYSKSSGKSYFTVNGTTGRITVKKGTPKGTYTVKIKVSAAAKGTYAAASKTITVKIKIK